jgi:hypothetical protein
MGRFKCGMPCRDLHGSAHKGVGSATAAEQMAQQAVISALVHHHTRCTSDTRLPLAAGSNSGPAAAPHARREAPKCFHLKGWPGPGPGSTGQFYDMHTPMPVKSMGLIGSGHPRAGPGGPTEPSATSHDRLQAACSAMHRRPPGPTGSVGRERAAGCGSTSASPPAAGPDEAEGTVGDHPRAEPDIGADQRTPVFSSLPQVAHGFVIAVTRA